MSAWIAALAAPALICAGIILLLRRSPWAARLADHPNERSLHRHPTPRLGGVAIMLAALPIAVVLSHGVADLLWALALGLALLSFADDLRSLPITARLAGHFAAAGLAIAWVAPPAGLDTSLAVALAATLALAWMINLYNFMDGADGLAGGMTAVGFAAYAIAAWQADIVPLALACAAIASAAFGFLAFNFPPARVFLGDSGSIPLGFLAGGVGAYGVAQGAWSVGFPLLVFSPFIVDASVTLLRRLARGERIWIAHRSHYYQRLVLSGWSARRLAGCFYALAGASAVGALLVRTQSVATQCAILALWSVFYVAAIAAIERRRTSASVSP